MATRENARQFAVRIGVHHETVGKWCRENIIPARSLGKGWQIDVEKAERALPLKFGNAAERDLARQRKTA